MKMLVTLLSHARLWLAFLICERKFKVWRPYWILAAILDLAKQWYFLIVSSGIIHLRKLSNFMHTIFHGKAYFMKKYIFSVFYNFQTSHHGNECGHWTKVLHKFDAPYLVHLIDISLLWKCWSLYLHMRVYGLHFWFVRENSRFGGHIGFRRPYWI